MAEKTTKPASRRQQVREQRTRATGTLRTRLLQRLVSWPTLFSVVFILGTSAIALLGEASLGYSVGQHIEHPVYARVSFPVPNNEQTEADREAAAAATPSHYVLNKTALTFDSIRADLMRAYQAATNAETVEDYEKTLKELKWPASAEAYARLRELTDDAGRARFQAWVNELPLEKEYVVRDLLHEPRDPKSTTDFIRLHIPQQEGEDAVIDVPHAELIPQSNERALKYSAAAVARQFRLYALGPVVETIVLAAFREQPTILFDRERTVQAMRAARDATPVAMQTFEEGSPFVKPGILGADEYELLRAERAAYLAFVRSDDFKAAQARGERFRKLAGLVGLVMLLTIGLLAYTRLHQPRIFEAGARSIAFALLILLTLLAVRLLDMKWPDLPELLFAPCLVAGSVMAIVYVRRFAMGAVAILSVLAATLVNAGLVFLLVLFTCVTVGVYQLDEIRSRTKLIAAGALTAVAVMIASIAGGFWDGNLPAFVVKHALSAGACALAASFIVSGTLPIIERTFRVATSLALLEWRDPTRPLLQRLAREAPGTYNHSLVLGTLAEAACERIGANGLLAQVGALYHDIGKIHKADYFAENQEGQVNRHDKLAPTMSLLIILGHVKDGIEMAREYKLPRVLHQFIEEHHGTTVVRYFHHVASEKQPSIASGRHDREVPEAEFRYNGPKPRSRESAVLMLCDGVEGAVRALPEATPSRIENVVHRVVMDRLNDGQFDDCDITLKQIRQVETSLVKSLCGIYHGRVAYPTARKTNGNGSAADRSESVRAGEASSTAVPPPPSATGTAPGGEATRSGPEPSPAGQQEAARAPNPRREPTAPPQSATSSGRAAPPTPDKGADKDSVTPKDHADIRSG